MRNAVAAAGALLVLAAGAPPAMAQEAARVGDLVAGKTPSGTAFRFVAKDGSAAFVVPGAWRVEGVQSKPPVAVAAFQLPNPASDGSPPEITNLTVSVYHLGEPAADAALKTVGERYGPREPTQSDYDGWTVYAQEAVNDGTRYTVLDALRRFTAPKLAVSVRVAWPHLEANAAGFEADTTAAYHTLLDSVSATPGAYQTKPGEVVRRPG